MITIFLIAIALAMDAFAVSISNGISIKNFNKSQSLKQGLFFGLFQFIMPIIGYILGNNIKIYIEFIDHWIAFMLLSAIGLNMIVECLKNDKNCFKTTLSNKQLIIQSIATSIYALAVGISLAILKINIFYSSFIIGMTAFILSFIGGILGNHLGGFFEKKAEFLGGIILIIIGIKILIQHIYY